MIRLKISTQPIDRDEEPQTVLSARVNKIISDPDEICSDTYDSKIMYLNMLLPQSQYNEIMRSKDSDCLLNINILTYAEDFIVSKDSVEAVEDLTNEQANTLWALPTGDTYQEIADKCFKSRHTINRHVQNLLFPLRIRNKCLAIVVLFRYLIERWPGKLKSKLHREVQPINRTRYAECRKTQSVTRRKTRVSDTPPSLQPAPQSH